VKYDDTDLGDYGLTALLSSPVPWVPPLKQGDLGVPHRAYSARTFLKPRQITVDCFVTAADRATLESYLDSLSLLLLPVDDEKKLQLDFPTGRYWYGKLAGPVFWEAVSPESAQGTLTFMCSDPRGYDDDETSSDFDVLTDPDNFNETPGGTCYIEPVWTLTAGETLSDVTVKLENVTTDEELQWTGTLTDGQELVVNTSTMVVTKEGSEDMDTVSGKFPRLAAGVVNSINVTAFGTKGTLNITYRDTYL